MISRQPLLVSEDGQKKGLQQEPFRTTMLGADKRARQWRGDKKLSPKAQQGAKTLLRFIRRAQMKRYYGKQQADVNIDLFRSALVWEAAEGGRFPKQDGKKASLFRRVMGGVKGRLQRFTKAKKKPAPDDPSERPTQIIKGPRGTQVLKAKEIEAAKKKAGALRKKRSSQSSAPHGLGSSGGVSYPDFRISLSGEDPWKKAKPGTDTAAADSPSRTRNQDIASRLRASAASRRRLSGMVGKAASADETRAHHGDNYAHETSLVRLHKHIHDNIQRAQRSGEKEAEQEARKHLDTFHKQHGTTSPWKRLKKATFHLKQSLQPDASGKQRKVYLTRPHDSKHWNNPLKYSIHTEKPTPQDPHHSVHVAWTLSRRPLLIETYGGGSINPIRRWQDPDVRRVKQDTGKEFQAGVRRREKAVRHAASERMKAARAGGRTISARQALQSVPKPPPPGGEQKPAPTASKPKPKVKLKRRPEGSPFVDAPGSASRGAGPMPPAVAQARRLAQRRLKAAERKQARGQQTASRLLRGPLLYEFQSSFAPGTSILGAPAKKGATTTANLALVAKGGEVFLGKKQLDLIGRKFKSQEACYKWAGKSRKKQEKCDEIPVAVGGVQTGMAMLRRSRLKGIKGN